MFVENVTKNKKAVSVADISAVGGGEEEVLYSDNVNFKVVNRSLVTLKGKHAPGNGSVPVLVMEIEEVDLPVDEITDESKR